IDETVRYRLQEVLSRAPGHLAALAMALLSVGMNLRRAATWRRGEGILICGLLAHLLGAGSVPGYLQYYLLCTPTVAMLVGSRLPALLRRRPAATACIAALFVAAAGWLRSVEFSAAARRWYALV